MITIMIMMLVVSCSGQISTSSSKSSISYIASHISLYRSLGVPAPQLPELVPAVFGALRPPGGAPQGLPAAAQGRGLPPRQGRLPPEPEASERALGSDGPPDREAYI